MNGQNKGFDISRNQAGNLVTVRVWGFWDLGLGKQFEQEFQEKVKEIGMNGGHWHLLLDFARCPPQSQEIQNMISDAIVFAKQRGMRKKAILAKWSIIPLQPGKLSQDPELKIHFYFQSEDDAVRWLLNEQSAKSRSA